MLMMNAIEARIPLMTVLGLVAIFFTMPVASGFTDPRDVYAINSLYAALGSPLLPGWISIGGDPCVEGWQGVQCVISNITAITLNGANLGGELGDGLNYFTSIITIDLSNNRIGGSLPNNLPSTLQRFFLSGNQLTGSIPSSLSGLTLLSDISLNSNLLTGGLPDVFQLLTGLINLDISNNTLTGQLPPSMGSLSSLITLHMENNQLSGTLDILQDLPLKDLNIENNLFSGPIPEKLMTIPNFKKDGNPFNTTIAPSSMPPLQPSPFSGAPGPGAMSESLTTAPAGQESGPPRSRRNFSTIRVVICAIVAVALAVVVVLLVALFISKCQGKISKDFGISKLPDWNIPRRRENHADTENLMKPGNEVKKYQEDSNEVHNEHQINMVTSGRKEALEKQEHQIKLSRKASLLVPPPVEQVAMKIPVSSENITGASPVGIINSPSSVTPFSIASLQQYTNSFSEENLIKDGRLGKVYLAELHDGKLLMVMKLDNANSKLPMDEFLKLISSISKLRHPNIVELVGYCAEFEQRLLVYNSHGTKNLHDILHYGDDLRTEFSWSARLQVALGAAKALEYLHECCRPPVIHLNFDPANVVLDDELSIHVSECGLASLTSSNAVAQLSGRLHALHGYEAPELDESGSHSDRSDVYSFGVVMLELLTGRKPYDSSRPRPEQRLVRWASSQLHEINSLSRMVDPSIRGKFPVKSLSRFADIISRCIQQGPEFRPPMSEVVQDLMLMVETAM